MDRPFPPAGDVLAQPTRARIFALLGELRRGAGTDEVAAALGLHPNGVRTHLDRLRDAGLVVRDRSRQARGRPRDVWTIAPDARPGGDAPTAYANLGRWLVRVLQDARTPVAEVEATGRRIGHELAAAEDATAPEEHFHAALAAMGFGPRRTPGTGDTITYTLANCPYRDAVAADPQRVCGLHRGLTAGLLERLQPASELASFVPRDPATAGCTIEVRSPARRPGTRPRA
jgi:predicted ArsR family transcriptional regulator